MYKYHYHGTRAIKVDVKTLNRKTRTDSLRGSLERKSLERNIVTKVHENVNHQLVHRLMCDVSDVIASKTIKLLNQKLGGY